jgi:hypothetical protein
VHVFHNQISFIDPERDFEKSASKSETLYYFKENNFWFTGGTTL